VDPGRTEQSSRSSRSSR